MWAQRFGSNMHFLSEIWLLFCVTEFNRKVWAMCLSITMQFPQPVLLSYENWFVFLINKHSIRPFQWPIFAFFWRCNHVAGISQEQRTTYRVWVGKPAGKRSLVRPRRRWQANIKVDLKVKGRDSVWLRIRTSCRVLWTRLWTFGFHK